MKPGSSIISQAARLRRPEFRRFDSVRRFAIGAPREPTGAGRSPTRRCSSLVSYSVGRRATLTRDRADFAPLPAHRPPFQPGANVRAEMDYASSERAIAEIWISSVPA
jgi:hypothetical protein